MLACARARELLPCLLRRMGVVVQVCACGRRRLGSLRRDTRSGLLTLDAEATRSPEQLAVAF